MFLAVGRRPSVRMNPVRWTLFGLALLALACEPASITDAHDQLGAGRKDTLHFNIPVTQDSFHIADFLSKSDTATTPTGVVGVKLDAESVKVNVGQQLKFNNLNFSPYAFSYSQMLTTAQVSTGATVFPAPPFGASPAPAIGLAAAAAPPQVRFGTSQGASLLSATVGTGRVALAIQNNSACSGTLTIAIKDSTGATIVTMPSGIPSYNLTPGSSVADTGSLNGKSFAGFATINPTFAPAGVCAPAAASLSTNATFLPMTLSSVKLKGISESFKDSSNALATETRIKAVDTVVVASGGFTITALNKLPIALACTIKLLGITKGGVPVSGVLNVAKAPGGGAMTSGVLALDLASATIKPKVVVDSVSCVASTGAAPNDTATISSTVTTNAVQVSGTGSLVVQSLSGTLDPAQTPELKVAVQNSSEMPNSSVDFGDFGDAVKDSNTHINDASAALTIKNTAATPLALQAFTLGAVQLNATGSLDTLADGSLDYEKDAGGQPIKVAITDPGQATLSVARLGTASVSVQAAPLIDRVVHLVLNKKRVAIVAAGNAVAGDGAQSRIISTDNVSVTFSLTVGLDFTLPVSGVAFTRNEKQDGAALEPADADDIASRILNAGVTASVTNGTAFGLIVNVAFVDGEMDSTVDIFATAGHVTLDSVMLPPSTVDAQGRVSQASVSTTSLTMSGTQARPLLGKKFTAGVRVRLTPSAGGRGAIRPTDQVRVFIRALLDVRGGAP
ncbi:MAG TPA: hypothetical protein VGI83_06155 [Gemmatimonadales bacterium]